MRYLFSILICGLATLAATAQDGHHLNVLAGPAGIYLYPNAPGDGVDSYKLAATDYVLIERASYDSVTRTTGNYKENGKARPVQNAKELRNYYSDNEISEVQRGLDTRNEEDLINFFQTHHNPNAYGLYYMVLATKLATGNIYLDKSAKPGTFYSYRATRVNRDGSKEVIGTGVAKAGAPNPALRLFHASMRYISVDDSSIMLNWRIPVDSLLGKPPAGFTYNGLALTAGGMKARVLVSDNGAKYHEAAILIPTNNDSEHIVTATYRQAALPERQYNAFLYLEDEVGNKGVPSDTLIAYTVSPGSLPVLRRLYATEVPDGVRLSWPAVKQKPYIVGVKITKYNDDGKLEELTVAPVTDTSYTDFSGKPGIPVRYFAEVLFTPGINLKQVLPVAVTGTVTEFSDPLPPFNLRVKNVGTNIQLDWDAQKQNSMFGFYVYRGTSPGNMDLVAGPIRKGTTFIDTAGHLSGRSQYFYSVQAENYRQALSPMSDNVVITPNRKIETTLPKGLQFYYANGQVYIRFTDVREDDNAITGYVLRGRAKGTAAYSYHSGFLTVASAVDSITTFAKGNTYQYQVAAVSMRGDTTAYSELYEFFMPKDPVGQMGEFYVRNTSDGVTVSWPTVVYEGRKAYNIYRRTADTEQYTKIATVPADRFSYADTTARLSEVYIYSIAITENDDREGERGTARSIRRELTKVTTISE